MRCRRFRATQWRATVAARLPSQRWPERKVFITAVDAHTGEPVVFDRHSGVELVDAVAASCASVPPYAIGEGRYIDGGYRCNENADLAAGYGRVLVLSPFGGRTRNPLEWGMQLAAQVEELRAGGSRVETIFPDSNSRNAFGTNMMDLSTRPPSARAGYDQGRALAVSSPSSGADPSETGLGGVTTPGRVHRFQDRHQRGTARRGRGHGPVPRALCHSAHSPHRIRPAHRAASQQRSTRALEQGQAVFALGRSMSVTPNAATQSPQPVLPIRPARSNTGKFGSAVAKMSPWLKR